MSAALSLGLLTPAAAWCAAEAVPAGKVFPGDVLTIRAPDSDGWHLMQSSPDGWVFARDGGSATESYVASVLAFPLSATTVGDEFVNEIRRGIEGDTSRDRFDALEATYEYSEDRGYPCVRYSSVSEDRKARTGFFRTEILNLQIRSLYCRHPQRPTLGFAAVFSRRGTELDGDLAGEAEDFIAGIQVPGTPPPPASR